MTPETSSPAVLFEAVSIRYTDTDAPVLRNVNLTIDEGELVVVVGRTGSGKSTLLSAINGNVPHFTGGVLSGRVVVDGRDTRTHRPRDLADVVGVVGQDPLAGFVTDTVEAELAYGMEQLALPAATMRKRVEETLDLLGIAELRDAPLRDLSGGQQQRVAIGAVLTCHPRIVVLDEPTSALDPTGAEDVLAAISRLVHDLATTVVIAEHRIERVLHHADSVVHVVDGRVEHGRPSEIMRTATVAPPVVELGRLAGWEPLPLSVRDARRAAGPLRNRLAPLPPPPASAPGEAALRASSITVRYGDLIAVRDVSVTLHQGSVTALMGRNGSGKSSLLWALQGSGPRAAGRAEVDGKDTATMSASARRELVGLVPQTASDLLYLESVAAELTQADTESGAVRGTAAAHLEMLAPGIPHDRHPRDLSEGQRLALVLAVQLTADPPVLLLDEPTRGLDYTAKANLARALKDLARSGHSVVCSTHDVEFVAESCDRVIVMAEGEVVADGPTSEVVVSSPAFAPQVAKIMAPGSYLTVAEVEAALEGRR